MVNTTVNIEVFDSVLFESAANSVKKEINTRKGKPFTEEQIQQKLNDALKYQEVIIRKRAEGITGNKIWGINIANALNQMNVPLYVINTDKGYEGIDGSTALFTVNYKGSIALAVNSKFLYSSAEYNYSSKRGAGEELIHIVATKNKFDTSPEWLEAVKGHYYSQDPVAKKKAFEFLYQESRSGYTSHDKQTYTQYEEHMLNSGATGVLTNLISGYKKILSHTLKAIFPSRAGQIDTMIEKNMPDYRSDHTLQIVATEILPDLFHCKYHLMEHKKYKEEAADAAIKEHFPTMYDLFKNFERQLKSGKFLEIQNDPTAAGEFMKKPEQREKNGHDATLKFLNEMNRSSQIKNR